MASLNGVRILNIPQVVEEDDLHEYLEEVLGEGQIESCKIVLHHDSARSKGFGFVHFKEKETVMTAVKLSSEGKLVLYNRELKLTVLERGIVQHLSTPTTYVFNHCTLSIGCLTSKDCMSSLWNYDGSVTLEVSLEKRTFDLHLKFKNMLLTEYKLEFHFSEISQLVATETRDKMTGFLLQVKQSPPYLYCRRREPFRQGDPYTDLMKRYMTNKCRYSEENWRGAWVRTTDFTPFNVIGQSFVYMIETESPGTFQTMILNQVLGSTRMFDSVPKKFHILRGSSYSAEQIVVPMVNPDNFRIPFDILYMINNLIQRGKLSGPTLDDKFFRQVSSDTSSGKLAMKLLASHEDVSYEPWKLLKAKFDDIKSLKIPLPNLHKLGKGRAWIHRLVVTPTKVYCMGPEVETSNRMVRKYEQYTSNFLRVNFVDENFGPLTSSALTSEMDTRRSHIYKRIKEVLREGIFIGNKKYDFLAFSASQLREGQLWMFAEVLGGPDKPEITGDSIRCDMGDFSQIRNVAKCAARMGQCFSSSTETGKVLPLQVKKIPDITVRTCGKTYCFSDGIGKISAGFARTISAACGLPLGVVPSAFQIRYGGYKGVVAVDPHASSSFKLYLRPSMHKFDSPHMGLEVLEWTHILPCFLNRQVISLLSTLGVKDSAFMNLQNQMISKLERVLEDDTLAMKLLRETRSSSFALQMLQVGYSPKTEPLLKRLLCVFKDAQLNELKTKAKIFVGKGRLLMGCLDETKSLTYGEVYIKISMDSKFGELTDDHGNQMEDKGMASVVTQKVFVAKNPCLHPGDVRVLQGVDVPQLQHMVDCIVFPQIGPRPHPNECSGSDLDGDLYLVSWEESLIPPCVDPPMDYTPAPTRTLEHPVTVEEIQEFFVDYMVNDNLGVIANAHVVHADREPERARNAKCLELAHLASMAVDFPKTGVPAVISMALRPKEYPDFMEKDHKATYVAYGILGRLYRSVKAAIDGDSSINSTFADGGRFCDKDLLVPGFEKHIDNGLRQKKLYDVRLIQLMNHYGIRDEAEILGGHVLSLSELFVRRQHDVQPKVRLAFEALQKEAKSWFHKRGMSESDEAAKASAWYFITYHQDYYGCALEFSEVSKSRIHLLSFPWVVSDLLFTIKHNARRLSSSSLVRQSSENRSSAVQECPSTKRQKV